MNFSEEKFIAKLKNKDPDALTAIIDSYHEALFKGALKQGLGLDQAEEVVQATWVTFLEAVNNFKGHSHIRTFIFGILYNKIKELWRSNKKYTGNYEEEHLEQIFSEDGNYIVPPIEPHQWSESKQFFEILKEELENIPYKQRMAFYLKEIEGDETENICNILDVSVTNLGVLIYRAKQNLRVRIERRFSEPGESHG